MEDLDRDQLDRRRHAETVISAAAPFLDLLMSAGERLSRAVEPVDHEYYPVRVPGDPDDDVADSRKDPSR